MSDVCCHPERSKFICNLKSVIRRRVSNQKCGQIYHLRSLVLTIETSTKHFHFGMTALLSFRAKAKNLQIWIIWTCMNSCRSFGSILRMTCFQTLSFRTDVRNLNVFLKAIFRYLVPLDMTKSLNYHRSGLVISADSSSRYFGIRINALWWKWISKEM